MIGWRALVAVGMVAAAGAEQPGGRLNGGTRLVYEAAGQQSEWRIDSVRLDSLPHCGTVWLTRGGNPERREHCVVDGMLSERQRDGRWVAVRPLLPGQDRMTARTGGGKVRYRTAAASVDTISGERYPVVETEVTTYDSTGRATQRLRERYSTGLTTATWGAFDRPDPVSGEWRVTTEFRLVRVIPP